jgi:ppGpp synthetase/RelA/SpoT-type nucleotidyltranferase
MDNMTDLTFTQIETAQFLYRKSRQLIQTKILDFLLTSDEIAEPFKALNRMFVRLKSADSIVEKINRKKLNVETIDDLQRLVTDVLGFRIITENMDELETVDTFLQNSFEVLSCNDTVQQPNEFGYQSIEYSLIYRDPSSGEITPFELQLRTMLQHQWSVNSFHLFHKKSPDVARPYQTALQDLSQTLAKVEDLTNQVAKSRYSAIRDVQLMSQAFEKFPIQAFVNLMVINPGEIFVDHVRLPASTDAQAHHNKIVKEKMLLYRTYPEAAVVECYFMDVTTYALNESHVIFLPQYFGKIQW